MSICVYFNFQSPILDFLVSYTRLTSLDIVVVLYNTPNIYPRIFYCSCRSYSLLTYIVPLWLQHALSSFYYLLHLCVLIRVCACACARYLRRSN